MKLTIPHILLLALLVLASCKQPNEPVTVTHGSISGVVLDLATDEPIIGAEVRALINDVVDTTDGLGMFLLDDLEPGADTLMITAIRIDTHYQAIYIQPDENEVTVSVNSKLSGDIIFSSNRTGSWETYMMEMDGSNQVQLTNINADYFFTPEFSPDGTKIYFATNIGDYQTDIMIMNRDGTGLTKLTENSEEESRPLMSPDGQHIVFTASSQVMIMNSDGSNQRILNENFLTAGAYAFSTAGDHILCVGAEAPGAGDFFTVTLDGAATNISSEIDLRGRNEDVIYSPTVAHIAFSIFVQLILPNWDVTNYTNNFIMEADGTSLVQLTSNQQLNRCLDFSPDGLRILYTEGQGQGGNRDLLVMGIDGTNVRNLTSSDADELIGSFIDDNHIIFDARDGATWQVMNYDIYLIDEVNEITTRLTDDPADDRLGDVFIR